jgi:hypothetical protein
MLQPQLKGQLLHVDDNIKSYVDKESGKVEEYRARSLHLFAPGEGVICIRVSGDGELPQVKQGATVVVSLQSFSVEKGTPRASCRPEGIKVG